MKTIRLAACGLLFALSLAAGAADRGSGELSLAEPSLVFDSGGPVVGLNLSSDPARTCLDPALPCDQYALGIMLPEDVAEFFPAARVRIRMSAPGPTGQDDLDLYLLDAEGNQLAASTGFQTDENITVLADGGRTDYIVEVQLYIALGATYLVNIDLELGEPSADKTDEEVAEWLSDNSALVARDTLLPSCTEPGVTVLTDAEGDGGLTVLPVPGTDLQRLDVFQTSDADGQPLIALRLFVDDLSSLIPQSVYFVSFNTDYGDVRGVRMEIDAEGQVLGYFSYVVSEDNDGERQGHFVEPGTLRPAHPMSGHTAEGEITFYVSPDVLALRLFGDTLSGFNAGATSFVGVEGAGVSFNNDAMPDGLARQGQFEYLAPDDCLVQPAEARGLAGSKGGALGLWLLILGVAGVLGRSRAR